MSITTFGFSTLHTKLKNKLSSIVNSSFKAGAKNYIRWSTNVTALWGKKLQGGIGYSRASLKAVANHLIGNCYFKV